MSVTLEYLLQFIHSNLNHHDQEELYNILDAKLFDKSETSKALYEEISNLNVDIDELKEQLAYEKSKWTNEEREG